MAQLQEHLADVHALYTQYARRLDDNQLDAWLDLFAPDCSYRLLPRENVDQGLPLGLMDCPNRGMLADRIVSLRTANFFNVHFSRHLLSNITITAVSGPELASEADYAVFQTDQEGVTRIFSVGRYAAKMRHDGDALRITDMRVVADTYGVRTLLAVPI